MKKQRQSKKLHNVGFGLQPLPRDNRDFPLSAVVPQMDISEIPEKFELPRLRPLHQGDSDFCTAFGADKMSEYQEGVEFEPSWGFAVSKLISGDADAWGQNLRDAFKRVVKYGSMPRTEAPFNLNNKPASFLRRIKNWPKELFQQARPYRKQSYVFIDGRYDPFDNICVALYQFRDERRALGSGLLWNWPLATVDIPDEVPKRGYGHFVVFTGYDRKRDALVLLNSYGEGAGEKGYHYVPRSIVNHFAERYGAGMFIDIPKETAKLIIKQRKDKTMAEATKPYLSSQTIQGMIKLAIPFLAMIAQFFGVELASDEIQSASDALVAFVLSVSGLWGIYDVIKGRVKARGNLKGLV